MLELNKIYCMDCLEGMKQLDDKSVDLIVTDPPYNFIANGGGFIKREKCKYLDNVSEGFGYDFEPEPYLYEFPRILKRMNMYVWCSKNLIHRYLQWAVENWYKYDILTWHKKNPVPLWNNKYISDTEYCIWIYESGKYFNSNLQDWRKYRKFFLTNIGIESNGHPTPKPLITLKRPIEISSKEGDLILDPFMGSGTTAVACKQLKRNFIGFEISPEYIKIAERRLSQETLTGTLDKYQPITVTNMTERK